MDICIAILILNICILSKAWLICEPSSRFYWLTARIRVRNDFRNFGERCCDVVNPGIRVDLDENCVAEDKGTSSPPPEFFSDPNDCQRYYECRPRGTKGGFTRLARSCDDCWFWDGVRSRCTRVDIGCGQTTRPPLKPLTDYLIGCVDFENDVNPATSGLYVYNNGVRVVNRDDDMGMVEGAVLSSSHAPTPTPGGGGRCGLFNGSQLEVPYFTNVYAKVKRLKISLDMYATELDASIVQGIISTRCDSDTDLESDSLRLTLSGGKAHFQIELANQIDRYSTSASYEIGKWQKVELEITGSEMTMSTSVSDVQSTSLNDYRGLRESYFPLVIGSLIADPTGTFYRGYLDNICFYVDYED